MVWKHIFWNDDFIVTNKENWEEDLAGKVFINAQFEIYLTMKNEENWPRFYSGIWDPKLKHVFLHIIDYVKKGAKDGASGGKNSPRINSMVIVKDSTPNLAIVMFDENQEPILEIPESLDDLQFFGDISHMV